MVLLCTVSLNSFAKKAKKPNVLVIYTDDHRYSGVHALGGQAVRTPNMDQLANTGIVFENAYLMGAFTGATCVPSRAMLLTGRQLFKLDGVGRSIPKEHTTIGEAFGNAGYNTHMVGKWHQDNPSLARSFDDGACVMSRGVYLVDHWRMPLWDWKKDGDYKKKEGWLLEYDENGKEVKRLVDLKNDKRGPTGTEKDGPHTSEIFARNAIKFINEYDEKDPYFMYLAFHAPHDPRQAPKKYKDMYPEDEISLLPSYMPQHPFDNGHLFLRDEELGPWPRTPEVARKHLSDYYAIITHLDAQIGKVIAALKESGQYENTIIVFAGDSGLGVGNHGLLGKQNVYDEDGVHVPFVLSGGAIKEQGLRLDAYCYIHDIFPTVCDLAKIERPASVTGKSLVPVINGEKDKVRDFTYHAYRQHQRAYRKGDYKLLEFVKAPDKDWKLGELTRGSRTTLLFNIKNDPWETTNLAFLPDYFDLVKTMQKEMKEKAIELGDSNKNTKEQYDFWDFY
ncbi:sulfatase-like hydrolase/transferase [Labilibacter marinus]|uniref:sulfatase-like hydrolase/transferase n=1 Tax=Labilibacter marinus TaxID=1477105 RepID=UPI000A591013|nr:sulfatase-like hydrolase/transferase [Labilibacter marinus]